MTDRRAVARHLVLEDDQLAEELATRMERDEQLTSVLVEEQYLDKAFEDDEPVCGGISLVVDDLVLFELAKRHVARELSAVDLGKDLDGQHVGERPRDLAELFDLHERESLGGR